MIQQKAISRVIGLAACLTMIGTAISPALAASVLTTPALSAGAGATINCRVLNAGTKDSPPVTIELVAASGSVTFSMVDPSGIAAGTTFALSSLSNPGTQYCRVTGISKGSARITLCVVQSGTCVAAVTVP